MGRLGLWPIIFATLTIIDDDGEPTINFSKAEYTVFESGSKVIVEVILSPASSAEISVQYETKTIDSTAELGADYVGANGTLIFPPGVKSRTFAITIKDDEEDEDSETINLALSNVSDGAALGSLNTAILTIADNDDLKKIFLPLIVNNP